MAERRNRLAKAIFEAIQTVETFEAADERSGRYGGTPPPMLRAAFNAADAVIALEPRDLEPPDLETTVLPEGELPSEAMGQRWFATEYVESRPGGHARIWMRERP